MALEINNGSNGSGDVAADPGQVAEVAKLGPGQLLADRQVDPYNVFLSPPFDKAVAGIAALLYRADARAAADVAVTPQATAVESVPQVPGQV